MKTKGFLILAVALTAAVLGCSNDKSNQEEQVKLPTLAVETAFWQKYSGASSVKWEAAGNFQKAEFEMNAAEYEAWFTISGLWLQAKNTSLYANLPVPVKDYIANSITYPPTSWSPRQETEVLERAVYPTFYGVELKNGENEVDVWCDDEAFRHMEVAEDYDGDDVPATISGFIAGHYRKGWITEVWKLTDGEFIAHVLDTDKVKQVYFTRALDWNYTEWPVLPNDLPDAVKVTLQGNAYEGFTVKSAMFQQHQGKEYYHIVLQQTNLPGPTTSVRIEANGEIVI